MKHALNMAALALALLAGTQARAVTVTVGTPFMNLENRAVNSLGFGSGQFVRWGANSVVPNGGSGTTGLAIQTGTGTQYALNFNPSPQIPNLFVRYVNDSAALRGDWTLKFSNGTDFTTAAVTLSPTAQQAPFVNSITLSGTSANPTFAWTPPPGATVNGYRVNIYDKSLVSSSSSGQVSSTNLQPNQTSFTVQASDFTVPGYGFQLGRNYSIEISLIQTKDGSSTNLANSNLQAIARVYADFTPSNSGGPVVNLPVVLSNGSYQYNMTVAAGQTYYIDPEVAVGYDYEIAAGNPNFATLKLPSTIGDGLYDIYGFDANGTAKLLAHDWSGQNVFSFGAGGVSKFRVLGIETSVGLDPGSTTAFVTGLSFAGSGLFTGTQTPITVAVPEPSSLLFMTLGLAGLGLARRRRG